jgi:hypothetical protein
VDFEHADLDHDTFPEFRPKVSCEGDERQKSLNVVVKANGITYSNLAPSVKRESIFEYLRLFFLVIRFCFRFQGKPLQKDLFGLSEQIHQRDQDV